MISKKIITDKNENVFYLRLNKTDSVGLATTESGENYLLLDSIDYWFDIIQEKYPSELKCICKNNKFNLLFNYYQRDDSPDYYLIELITTCTECKKQKKQMSVTIDYSPTEDLFHKPLIFCKKPKVKYKLYEITSFWMEVDVYIFLEFMNENNLINHAFFWLDGKRHYEILNVDQSKKIFQNNKLLTFNYSLKELDITFDHNEEGVVIPRDIWRKNEVITFHSPINMVYSNLKKGKLYYINYSNEYIDNYTVKKKSDDFITQSDGLYNWLQSNFTNARGKNCFDNKKELKRLFGSKYKT